MKKLIDECAVCANRQASADGHRPGCPKGARVCCAGCHLYPCVEDSSCQVWLEAAHKRMTERMFDNAELWYAAEVERMSKRAPA